MSHDGSTMTGTNVSQLRRELREIDHALQQLSRQQASMRMSSELSGSMSAMATSSSSTNLSGGSAPAATLVSALQLVKENLRRLRLERVQCKREFETGKKRVVELQNRRKEKLEAVNRLNRNDMSFKDPVTLKAKLDMLNKRFQLSTFSHVREEQTFVAEIDKLKRNEKLLERYIPMQQELAQIQNETRLAREHNQRLYEQRRANMRAIDAACELRANIQKSMRDMRVKHTELLRRRRSALGQLQIAIEHGKKDKEKDKVKSTRCDSYDSHTSDDLSDLLTLPPFGLEKRHCSVLLNYVHQLQPDPNRTYASAVRGSLAHGSSNESLDNGGDDVESKSPTRRGKKKGGRRSTKRPEKSIVHPVHMLSAFDNVSVPAPRTYGDLPGAATQLNELLLHYDQLSTWAKQADEDLNSIYGDDTMATSDSGTCGASSTTMSDLSMTSSMMSINSARSPPAESVDDALAGLSLARSQSAIELDPPSGIGDLSGKRMLAGNGRPYVTSPLAAEHPSSVRPRPKYSCPQRKSAGGDLPSLRAPPPLAQVPVDEANSGIETSGDGSKDPSPHVSLDPTVPPQRQEVAPSGTAVDTEVECRAAGAVSPPLRQSSGIDPGVDQGDDREGLSEVE